MNIKNSMKILTLAAAGFVFTVAAGAQSAVTPAAADPSIAQRKVNQQERIANGVQSGSLTPHETANLESKEGALNRETRDMRKLNNGELTPGDKRIVNAQQNRLSRRIYRDKHNGRARS